MKFASTKFVITYLTLLKTWKNTKQNQQIPIGIYDEALIEIEKQKKI